ncbi:MAG: insulinase family protein [Porphyrobacter sp.]|nr:insulinase family protein [Porphyrobacter sp.]
MLRRSAFVILGLVLALASLLVPLGPPLAAQGVAAPDKSAPANWPVAGDQIERDPAFVFGTLPNGLRYILRQNTTPAGTALVRMRIGSGSLEEREHERGLAHFLEHMAFNGSRGIPEGEMVKLLEREGLAFGADTNATTGLEGVTYLLNLPRNTPALLDTALMLLRETASELTLDPQAVERERGVILAEKRDRSGYAQRALEANIGFIAPGARYGERLPIGTTQVIEQATADDLRALYQRTYVPANTTIIIVGDYPVADMAAAITARFADWQGPPPPPSMSAGPIDTARRGETAIHLDPALSESVTLTQLTPYRDKPDTLALRDIANLRAIGYAIVNRRLVRLARSADAPFRSAAFGTSDLFREARLTTLTVSSEDGAWDKGVRAAVQVVNEAMTYGFSEAEVAEQIANWQSALDNAAKAAETRGHSIFVTTALAALEDQRVPTTPAWQLAQFTRLTPAITAPAVWRAMLDDASIFYDPLIRFVGRTAPAGGEAALRQAFTQGMELPISAPVDAFTLPFAYQAFGTPGQVVSDTVEPALGLRLIRFANGVRLTLKQTTVREDRVAVALAIDGGDLLNTRANPLATAMVGSLASGGLGRHSRDELASVLAGRSVAFGLSSGTDAFTFSATTTPRDLTLQLQLITALITDPGQRREGEEQYRRSIDNFFSTLEATPARALGSALGGILSDRDPRFTLQTKRAYEALTYARLMRDIGDRLAQGAIEIAIVGDVVERDAIAAVALTLGALPVRESTFQPRPEARQRSFTDQRGRRIVIHRGEIDQALVQMIWPTTDDSDQTTAVRLNLLARVAQIKLTERLREQLGQTYSPSASASNSRAFEGYGTFTLGSSAAADEAQTVAGAMRSLVADLVSQPVDPDVLERASRPLLEAYDNTLKDLGGWLGLAARAQSEPDRLGRWQAAPALIRAITPQDLQATAAAFLAAGEPVEVLVVPETTALALDRAK